MSLNDITLTPTLLADLYPDVLLEQSGQNQPLPTVSFLGRNEKKILIVTIEHEAVFVEDKRLNFLTAVLDACKLGLADVAIVNWQNLDENTRANLTDILNPKSIILFGVDPVAFGLPVNFPPFQVQEFNKRTYVHSPLLQEIEADVALKKQLWAALKKLFCI